MFKAMRSTVEGKEWQPLAHRQDRCPRVDDLITKVERDNTLSIKAEGQGVIGIDDIGAQDERDPEMRRPGADVFPQRTARLDRRVDGNEGQAQFASKPCRKETAHARADDQPAFAGADCRGEGPEHFAGGTSVIDGHAVDRCNLGERERLVFRRVEAGREPMAIEDSIGGPEGVGNHARNGRILTG